MKRKTSLQRGRATVFSHAVPPLRAFFCSFDENKTIIATYALHRSADRSVHRSLKGSRSVEDIVEIYSHGDSHSMERHEANTSNDKMNYNWKERYI